MMDDLYHTAPHHLDTFIFNKLQPDQTFHEQVGETIHKICRFLKEQCSIKIIKTVKGGSSGKGTALKNGSDADLVIFVSHFKSFRDQKNNRGEILNKIRDMLQECQQSLASEIIMSEPQIITLPSGLPFSPRSLNFHFKSRELYESIEVDVLPAFDALGQLTKYSPSAQVYVDLIKAGGDGGEFSTCFTELQRNFVKWRPPKLKGLIRLVKHWYSMYVRPYKRFMRSGEFLPPKYALELLIIHAWESAEKGENFSTAEGFRTVMELIVEYEELWMFWTDNYNFNCPFVGNFLKDKLQEPRPMILDPADPTGNVAGNARWDLVAQEAQNCLQQNCVWNIISWDVEPVKGVRVSVEPHDISLSINPFIPIRNIKQQLEAQASVSVFNHYLEWNGQMLDEDRTLSNYRIFDDVTFDLKEQSSSCILLYTQVLSYRKKDHHYSKLLRIRTWSKSSAARGPPKARPRPAQGPPKARPRPAQGPPKARPSAAQGPPKAHPRPAQGLPKCRTRSTQGPSKARPSAVQGLPKCRTRSTQGPPKACPRPAQVSPKTRPRPAQGLPKLTSVKAGTMALYRTEPKRLDDFIKTNLEPDAFNVEVRNAVHRICEFLRNVCFNRRPEIKVIKAVKGGSTGKGTALRNGSDADLVVFLSCFKGFQEQRDTRQEVLEEIRQMLETCSRSLAYEIRDINITIIPNSSIPPKSLSFALKSKKRSSDSVEFDVLPAFVASVGLENANEAHLKLIHFVSKNGDPNGEFSACFTELQRKFVKQRYPKVKDLIRLVKHWYKQHVKPRKSELRGVERLPAKYAVELLTIYAWEQGNGMERFSMEEGFRTVLELICRYQELCIYWIEYYDVNNKVIADFLTQKLRANRPIILDPADPTGNVGPATGWHVMVEEARICLSQTCVSGVRGWNVLTVQKFKITVIGLDGSVLLLHANINNKISMIKQQIEQDRDIPAHQQRLMFNKTILNDHETLLDCGIFFDAELQLLHLLPTMEIFVINSDGRNLKFNVSPTDKVSTLKNKIESSERIRSNQYYLTFQSRPLEDGHTLKYYGIKTHSTININLRLRGGRVIQLLNVEYHN
uniref:2'-5'-oligoadenylate synthase 2-like n=1 Tax=Pristiophorus japonicus TaxID=55135 RepID=UPI00398EF3E0